MNAKQKILKYLSKQDGKNTATAKQFRFMFKIKNVYARIGELRKEGHQISTNFKLMKDGRKVAFYTLQQK